ncbi:AAA family ATPase [bacterium]|nr:AAA family ATPase [bacterium]
MYIEELLIEGYKAFNSETSVQLHNGLNVLVGENGTGKSSIIDAIRLILQEDNYRRSGVRDTDFYTPFIENAEAVERIKIQAVFFDLSEEERTAFLPWTISESRSKLVLQIDNKENNRGYRRSYWGGMSRDSQFEYELFDTINCIYLPPLRDAEASLRPGRSSRLARLLVKLYNQSDEEAAENDDQLSLEVKVNQFNEELSEDETIAAANRFIQERLLEALGSVFSQETSLQFSTLNFQRIVEGLRLLFFPNLGAARGQALYRELEENSLGYNNLLYLATILAELSNEGGNGEFLKVLLIEEPEAHLHPQLQIRLLKYLENQALRSDIQIIISTHSPVLASSASLNSIIHLSRSGDGIISVPLEICGLPSDSQRFLHRWMDVTKSTLLFARGVIFVEGIGEAMLISELARRILVRVNAQMGNDQIGLLPEDLKDLGVTIINMGGIYFKHFMQLFCDLSGVEGSQSIPVRAAGITDNDPEVRFPTFENRQPGRNPAIALQEAINASENCRLFVSPLRTLEYDLAMHDENLKVLLAIKEFRPVEAEVRRLVDAYAAQEWPQEIVQNQQSKAVVADYLVNHIDKGEYSLDLAEFLQSHPGVEFTIPDYIRDAILWIVGGNDE